MNKYGPVLFRSLALGASPDIHISDEDVLKKELKWSKGDEHLLRNTLFVRFTFGSHFDCGLHLEKK